MNNRNDDTFIKLYRKIQDSKVWYYTESQFKVWITILLNVNWTESWARHDGEEVKLSPGEMVTSINYLSDQSHVSNNVVRKTIDKLEEDDMISTDPTNQGTRLKVLNWDKYQQNGEGADMRSETQGDTQGDMQSEQRSGTQTDTQTDPQTDVQGDTQGEDTLRNKEVKEGEEEKDIYSLFDQDGQVNDTEHDEDNRQDKIKEVYNYWVRQEETVSHRNMTGQMESTLNARFEDGWTVEEMKEAIDNLCLIIRDDDYYWSYTNWSVDEFFKRNEGEKANAIRQNVESYKKNEDHGSNGVPEPLSNKGSDKSTDASEYVSNR